MLDIIDKILRRVKTICKWLAFFSAACLCITMILNFVDVVGTKWFGWSIPGALDFTEELMVFMTIPPLAYIALERGHINIAIVEEHVRTKVRIGLRILSYTIGFLVMSFFTWRVFYHFIYTIEFHKLKEGIDFPIWPANLAVFIGFAFLALVYILLVLRILVSHKIE